MIRGRLYVARQLISWEAAMLGPRSGEKIVGFLPVYARVEDIPPGIELVEPIRVDPSEAMQRIRALAELWGQAKERA